jgi:hypothetical protein
MENHENVATRIVSVRARNATLSLSKTRECWRDYCDIPTCLSLPTYAVTRSEGKKCLLTLDEERVIIVLRWKSKRLKPLQCWFTCTISKTSLLKGETRYCGRRILYNATFLEAYKILFWASELRFHIFWLATFLNRSSENRRFRLLNKIICRVFQNMFPNFNANKRTFLQSAAHLNMIITTRRYTFTLKALGIWACSEQSLWNRICRVHRSLFRQFSCFLQIPFTQCYFSKKKIGSGTHRETQNSIGRGGGEFFSGTVQNVMNY